MKRHSHIIGQQVFDINFSSKARGRELQDKISYLFNARLQEGMENLFDRIVPRDKMLRVDNLTIDIGNIRFESLDDEFVDKIIEKLEREISVLLLHHNSAPGHETDPHQQDEAGSYLSLLEYFLLKGTLPWWAGGENAATPFLAFEFLLERSPQLLVALLMRIGQRSYVRRRLVYQFSEEQVRSLIHILEPAEAEFIFDYHSEVVRVQQQKQLIKNEESEFKKAVWEFILTYLVVDRGSHFNRKEFVRSTLAGMAGHFSVSFDSLLGLFATSLVPGSAYFKNVDSLQAIILEIALEQGTRVTEKTALDEMLTIPAESPETGTDLIRYYLTFGSFPWWSANVTASELEELVADMVGKFPRTIESLIKSVGQLQHSRKIIVKTFKEETLHRILAVIEPENAEFITDYIAEIKTTHTKKAVLKARTEDLHEAIWEFILEYLLVDRGSEFNRRVFLESNINRLARRFNLSYRELLVFMVNNIAVSHPNSPRHLNLFQGLTFLYNIQAKNESPENPDSYPARAFPESQDIIAQRTVHHVNLLNVLFFWLRTGHKPWWAGQYGDISPAILLDQLIKESPAEAIIFVKHAGLQVKTRKRLVYQASFESLLNLFRLLPPGEEIVKYARGLLLVVKSSRKIKYSEDSVSERILLFSLWETLIGSSYTELNPVQFVGVLVNKLALWFQIPVKRLVDSLKTDHSPELGSLVKDAYQHIQSAGIDSRVYDQQLLEDWSENNSIEQLLEAFLAGKKETEKGTVTEEALLILEFFLLNNRLPDDLKIYSSSSVNSFLKQLILFLSREMPSGLKNMLGSDRYRGEQFLRIHEIFSVSNSIAESHVSNILATYLEKDILLFIKQHGSLEYGGETMLSFIDRYINEPGSLNTMQFLKQLLKYSPVSMQLAYYYKNETAYRLINNDFIQIGWGNQTSPFLRSFNTWLLELVHDRLDRERIDLLFRTFNFIMIGGEVRTGSLRDYLNRFFAFIFDKDYQLLLRLASLVRQRAPEKPVEDQAILNSLNDIDRELDPYIRFKEVSAELTGLLTGSEARALKQINPDIEDHKQSERKLLKEELALSDPSEPEETDQTLLSDKDTIYIRNSGLVILHPFLSTYFTRLQMLDKGDFINEEMRHRAVHLLQYLAFGTNTNEEHELVLNKILCNIPVEEPVAAGIELTEQEKTVSAELLNAVIVQWEKLKNSTAESLQASFLQRDGALYKADENWNLKVEQRGYDVLLSTLPWGLGMIKTPWMSDFIYVEWM